MNIARTTNSTGIGTHDSYPVSPGMKQKSLGNGVANPNNMDMS
jgi:hypothetical protein